MGDSRQGVVFDIKEFTIHDGPGIRATIFLKGCPLRCLWCHNPEGIAVSPTIMATQNGCTGCKKCYAPCSHEECREWGRCVYACPYGLLKIAGVRMSAQELAQRMHRLAPMLVGGGVTISGGEPLMQPDFLWELLLALDPLHTIIETCGYATPDVFRRIAAASSMIYLDIKHLDSARHKELTGVGNEKILTNLRWLLEQGKPFLVRVPLIAGCNDDEENLTATAECLAGSQSLCDVELMPLNPFSAVKYGVIGQAFPLAQMTSTQKRPSAVHPTDIFTRRGIPCKLL